MSWQRILHNIGWPALAGLLAALIALLAFPQLSGNSPFLQDLRKRLFSVADTSEKKLVTVVSYHQAVAKAAPAVVNIYTSKKVRRRHPLLDDPRFRLMINQSNRNQQQRIQRNLGSGVIISKQGYILTNSHVIEGADEIRILLADGREDFARLIGMDKDSDLAVLKIDLDNLSTLSIGSPGALKVGDVVLAIGNPLGLSQSVTQGIISATGRYGISNNPLQNYIQTDAAINPGNSGGALIDAYGNLVGINTIIAGTGYSIGLGFAIPAHVAVEAMEDIIEFGRVIHGWLGITAKPLTPQVASRINMEFTNGLLVHQIVSNSPAQAAGLRPLDVITHINNEPVGDTRQSMRKIANTPPGESIDIEILRNGNVLRLVATLGLRPEAG